ncbi:Glycosyltransferase RgtA/B/C/D-like domain-containing protein [uncultured Gammaproteobacteria bacterium]
MISTHRNWRRPGWAVRLLALLAVLGYGLTLKPPQILGNDSPAYLNAAYHLLHHGTFSEASTDTPTLPTIGREPGYGLFLAGVMALDPWLGQYRPSCASETAPCPPSTYRSSQWLNGGLIAAAGLALFQALRLANLPVAVATTAAVYLLANVQAASSRHSVASDYLALFLVCLILLAIARAARRPGFGRGALVGGALAALTLVKGVFLVLALATLPAALILGAVLKPARRVVLVPALAATLVYGAVVGGWMERNRSLSGDFALTDSRSGMALSTREVFNHMTPIEYVVAMVYWTRGCGDGLARGWFAPELWRPFRIEQPGGYFDRGEHGYFPRVSRAMTELGLDRAAAIKRVDGELKQAILDRPLTHVLATVPVFYRGLWIDEAIVFGLPALVWAMVAMIRRRRWLAVVLLLPGVFNLLFYALISLNIPRYQITAMPTLALAAGLALPELVAWLRRLNPLNKEKYQPSATSNRS